MQRTKTRYRKTIAYVECEYGELNDPPHRPFFLVRLTQTQGEELLGHVKACAETEGREWYTLTATHEKPARLRLTHDLIPDYEHQASSIYLRGEPVRVSGNGRSCNINFSGAVGARLVAERIEAALARARRSFDLRILSRKRNLIEFIPDTEREAEESREHEHLAQTGANMVAEIWPSEDFRDWEVHARDSTK